MKVTLQWLKQYVDFDWTPEVLSERLTMLGMEVEGVQKIGGEFEGIVVAQVITRDKHPNADKLSLCRVNDGKGERQIVCGAQNFQAGDKVPLILPGATLAAKPGSEPMTIKVGKIRGVESQGMLCSPQELGLPDQVDGLLILRADAKVGQPFAEQAQEEVALVVEVLVQGGLGQPRRGRDLSRGGIGQAECVHDLLGGVEDRVARGRWSCPSRHLPSFPHYCLTTT